MKWQLDQSKPSVQLCRLTNELLRLQPNILNWILMGALEASRIQAISYPGGGRLLLSCCRNCCTTDSNNFAGICVKCQPYRVFVGFIAHKWPKSAALDGLISPFFGHDLHFAPYSCFLSTSLVLVWRNERWRMETVKDKSELFQRPIHPFTHLPVSPYIHLLIHSPLPNSKTSPSTFLQVKSWGYWDVQTVAKAWSLAFCYACMMFNRAKFA